MTAFYYAIAVTGYGVWGDTTDNKFGRVLPDDVLTGYPGPKWVSKRGGGWGGAAGECGEAPRRPTLAFDPPPRQAIVLSNILVLLHMIPAYQVWSQPLFECVELAVEERVHARGGKWPLGLSERAFRLAFRSLYVVLTTFFACLIPFMGVILGERGRRGREATERTGNRRRNASPAAHTPRQPPHQAWPAPWASGRRPCGPPSSATSKCFARAWA